MRTSENSSDLERAPGARSIAVEFSEVRMAVQKLQRCENTTFHFHAAPFGIRTLRSSVFRPAFRLPSGLPSFHAFRLPVSPSLVFHRRPAVQPTTAYCCPLHLRITPGQSIYILPHTYASTTLKSRQPRVQPELDLALCAVSVFPSVPSPVSRLPSSVFRLPSSVPSSVFRPLPSAPVRSMFPFRLSMPSVFLSHRR